jgi:mediator of RNA polymerase II transcription subunit 21
LCYAANQKELVTDLVIKAKQVEYLIQSLPEPEPEEEQVRPSAALEHPHDQQYLQAKRMQTLEEDMTLANAEYIQAVARTSTFSCPLGRLSSFDTSRLNILPPFICLFT